MRVSNAWVRRLAVAFVVLMAGAAGAALAAGGGSRVLRISGTGGYAEEPALAVDGQGDAVVAWTNYVPSDPDQFAVVTASRRAGSGAWSPVVTIPGSSADPAAPAVALAPSGAGVLAWLETVPETQPASYATVLRVTTRSSPTAAWRQPVTISSPTAQTSGFEVGIDGAAEATVVWTEGYTPSPPINVATGSALTGRWG